MDCLPFHSRAARGYTLVEITLVVLILGILTVFAARQLDGSDAARAQELQTVAVRMAGDWSLIAASCSIDADVDKSALNGSAGGALTVLTHGAAGLRPDLQACVGATSFKPLDDVLQSHATAATLEDYPVSLSGGSRQPFTVTYNNVPAGVAADAAIKFAAQAPALPLPAANQTDARVRWQRQDDGDYTVAFLFDRAAVAVAAPSPWPAATSPSVAALTPVALSTAPVHPPVVTAGNNPQPCSANCGGLTPPPCVANCGGGSPQPCVSNCGGNTPPPCTANCGSVSPPATSCAGNYSVNFGSSSSGPGSSAVSGGGYTASNGSTTGTNNYTTSAGPGSASANGGGTNTTTGNGNGPASQNAGNCTQTSASGNGGSASTTGGSWAGGSTSGGGTVTTTTWGNGDSSVSNGSGGASSSAGGGTSSAGSGSSGLSLSASGGGATSGGGSAN